MPLDSKNSPKEPAKSSQIPWWRRAGKIAANATVTFLSAATYGLFGWSYRLYKAKTEPPAKPPVETLPKSPSQAELKAKSAVTKKTGQSDDRRSSITQPPVETLQKSSSQAELKITTPEKKPTQPDGLRPSVDKESKSSSPSKVDSPIENPLRDILIAISHNKLPQAEDILKLENHIKGAWFDLKADKNSIIKKKDTDQITGEDLPLIYQIKFHAVDKHQPLENSVKKNSTDMLNLLQKTSLIWNTLKRYFNSIPNEQFLKYLIEAPKYIPSILAREGEKNTERFKLTLQMREFLKDDHNRTQLSHLLKLSEKDNRNFYSVLYHFAQIPAAYNSRKSTVKPSDLERGKKLFPPEADVPEEFYTQNFEVMEDYSPEKEKKEAKVEDVKVQLPRNYPTLNFGNLFQSDTKSKSTAEETSRSDIEKIRLKDEKSKSNQDKIKPTKLEIAINNSAFSPKSNIERFTQGINNLIATINEVTSNVVDLEMARKMLEKLIKETRRRSEEDRRTKPEDLYEHIKSHYEDLEEALTQCLGEVENYIKKPIPELTAATKNPKFSRAEVKDVKAQLPLPSHPTVGDSFQSDTKSAARKISQSEVKKASLKDEKSRLHDDEVKPTKLEIAINNSTILPKADIDEFTQGVNNLIDAINEATSSFVNLFDLQMMRETLDKLIEETQRRSGNPKLTPKSRAFYEDLEAGIGGLKECLDKVKKHIEKPITAEAIHSPQFDNKNGDIASFAEGVGKLIKLTDNTIAIKKVPDNLSDFLILHNKLINLIKITENRAKKSTLPAIKREYNDIAEQLSKSSLKIEDLLQKKGYRKRIKNPTPKSKIPVECPEDKDSSFDKGSSSSLMTYGNSSSSESSSSRSSVKPDPNYYRYWALVYNERHPKSQIKSQTARPSVNEGDFLHGPDTISEARSGP
jgi:hypothetical protein